MSDHSTNNSLEAILNNAVDAIVTIDTRGIVNSVNPAAERLFGYEVDEVVGQNVSIFMPSPYREGHDEYMATYLGGGPPRIIGIGREVVGRRKDGSVFPMHLAVSEFHDRDQRMFTGIIRDITDIKEAERQLKLLNEQLEERVRARTEELHAAQSELLQKEKLATLGQVSGGIAHEIRNPLNAVKTSVYYLLHAKSPTKEKTTEHLERIDRQVTLIDNVVTALSDVAKLPDPQFAPVAVENLLRGVVRAVGIPQNIEVVFELPDELPEAMADEHQIPIAFKNLVRNARDAMEGGGTITLGALRQENQIHIFVADTGHGIPAEKIEKVLEPLYSTKARGMGLGLAITQAIVEKNGGEPHVGSVEDRGSRFAIVLQASLDQTPSN